MGTKLKRANTCINKQPPFRLLQHAQRFASAVGGYVVQGGASSSDAPATSAAPAWDEEWAWDEQQRWAWEAEQCWDEEQRWQRENQPRMDMDPKEERRCYEEKERRWYEEDREINEMMLEHEAQQSKHVAQQSAAQWTAGWDSAQADPSSGVSWANAQAAQEDPSACDSWGTRRRPRRHRRSWFRCLLNHDSPQLSTRPTWFRSWTSEHK